MNTSFGPTGIPGVAGTGSSAGASQFGYAVEHDRVVRKEVNLGVVREMHPPEDLLYPTIAPMMEVPTDDFVFDRVKPHFSGGMVPARAQNAESELAQHDFRAGGQGRGSLMDWAHKDFYDATDVYNYRSAQDMIAQLQASNMDIPTTLRGSAMDLAGKMARDQADRVSRIHRRFEHIVMTSLHTGTYGYNDGRIVFSTPWDQPADQRNVTPKSGTYAADTHDPIGDFLDIQEKAFERYGITLDRVIGSRKAFNTFFRTKMFIPRTGFSPNDGVGMESMNYLMNGWGPQAGLDFVMQQVGMTPIIYDSVYRDAGQVVRYLPEGTLIFLPSEASISQFDSTAIGFAKTCTSPHAEGGFQSGMYEWETSQKDPWQLVSGTGIKAYPIMNHMECVYSMKVTLPA